MTDLAIIPDAELTPTGLSLPTRLSQEAWEEVGYGLAQVADSSNWWVGDWLAAGERAEYGSLTAAADILGLGADRLSDIAAVCRQVQLPSRNGNLTFTHHRAVAPLTPAEQAHYLSRAEADGLSVTQLRDAIKADKAPTAGAADTTPSADLDHIPAEDVEVVAHYGDAADEIEREYGIGTESGTPRNDLRAAVAEAVRALHAVSTAIDGVPTWGDDVAVVFNPLADAFESVVNQVKERY